MVVLAVILSRFEIIGLVIGAVKYELSVFLVLANSFHRISYHVPKEKWVTISVIYIL